MITTLSTHRSFEKMAREYLAEHNDIPHKWREIHDVSGGRTDLVCWPDTSEELFASLTEYQITVGNSGSTEDFEKFGRKISDEELAGEAWAQFMALITEIRHNDA